jgi:hypothetical protein
VLVAAELEPVARTLREALDLGEPFRDPGVGEFGLANVVFALGDCFIEVVSPTREGTAAGRHLARSAGDAGYMVLFDVEDLEGARGRAVALGVRVVWQLDLPDISGTHLHPADMRGAIVSLDRSDPYGTWRWGGPSWTGQIGSGAPGHLAGITVAVDDPATVAARWAHVLGVAVSQGEGGLPVLALDGAQVHFVASGDAPRDGISEIAVHGITEIAVRTPAGLPGGAESVAVAGVRLHRVGSP